MILNQSAIKKLVKEHKPSMRVSAEYMEELNEIIKQRIRKDMIRNNGNKTMAAKLLNWSNGQK